MSNAKYFLFIFDVGVNLIKCVLYFFRFRIMVKVSDGCYSMDFVIPDCVVENLIKKSCREVLSQIQVETSDSVKFITCILS